MATLVGEPHNRTTQDKNTSSASVQLAFWQGAHGFHGRLHVLQPLYCAQRAGVPSTSRAYAKVAVNWKSSLTPTAVSAQPVAGTMQKRLSTSLNMLGELNAG